MLARQRDGGDDVVGIVGTDDADRDLAIIRRVGGVERARAVVEAHLAAELAAQFGGERRGVDVDALHAVGVVDVRRGAGLVEADGIEAARVHSGCKSIAFNSTPIPGRERSGRMAPFSGSRKPSK